MTLRMQPVDERAIADLGAFEPPFDHRFEPEFDASPPRPIPPSFRHGLAARRARAAGEALLAVSIVLFVVHRTGWLDRVARYLLPLAYLGWIAIGLASIALLLRFVRRSPPNTGLVREGTPTIARLVRCQTVQPSGDDLRFAFALDVQYRDPETHQVEVARCVTEPVGFKGSEHRYALTLQPGDYFTVVGMPGKFAETLRVYGLLNLNPHLSFVTRDGHSIRPWPMWQTVGTALGITAAACLFLLAGAEVIMRIPRDGLQVLGIVAGVAAAAGLVISILTLRYHKKPAPRARQDVFGVFVLGVVGVPVLACIATVLGNAFLDRSPPDYRDIEVVEMTQTTHSGIWRNYDLKYREIATGREEEQTTIVDVLDAFSENELGVIDVAAGRFGMPWVRGMHALLLVPVKGDEAPGALYEVPVLTADGETKIIRLKPMIQTGPDSYILPSDALLAKFAIRFPDASPDAAQRQASSLPVKGD